jgi:two-component system sensor histidine kinase BarA
MLQTLRVLNLGTRVGNSLDDYMHQLDLNPQGIGIIWVRDLFSEDLDTLRLHPSLLARTLIARNSLMSEENQASLLAHGARFMPLTLSIHSLNQAIQRRLRPGTASRDAEDEIAGDAPQLTGLRFLVADDNAVNRRLLAEIIHQQGAEVRQVEDGASAVETYHQDAPDVVLMDVHMPVKDGIQALQEIRAEDPTARIVAVTADARPEMHISLLQQGFDQVLAKPISEQDLLECVQSNHQAGRRASRRNIDPARDMPQPVHDPVLALQRAGGNPQLARDMLDMLIRDAQKALDQIRDASLGNDALLELVHRIHGGSRYCGTPRLNTRSQALESALSDGRLDDVPALLEVWKEELQTLSEQGDTLLKDLDVLKE